MEHEKAEKVVKVFCAAENLLLKHAYNAAGSSYKDTEEYIMVKKLQKIRGELIRAANVQQAVSIEGTILQRRHVGMKVLYKGTDECTILRFNKWHVFVAYSGAGVGTATNTKNLTWKEDIKL